MLTVHVCKKINAGYLWIEKMEYQTKLHPTEADVTCRWSIELIVCALKLIM